MKEIKTLKEITLEQLNKELSKLDKQKDSDEWENVNKVIAFVEENENSNWNIEFEKKGNYWNPNYNKSKNVWFKVLDHKAFIFIKFWKNNYLQTIKLGEIK